MTVQAATRVTDWRILAGPDASSLPPVAVASWNGLDTTLALAGTPGEREVVARSRGACRSGAVSLLP